MPNPRNPSIAGMADEYDKLKKFDDAVKENKERNALLDAEQAKENARQAKREEASATTKQERRNKSTKAGDDFIQKHKEFKQGSLKAYDNFVAAMMEIAGLVQAWGKSVNADIWTLLAGPLWDLATSTLPNAAAAAIASARRVSEYELAAVLTKNPLDMVAVSPSGNLDFKSFEDERDVLDKIAESGKAVPPNFFEDANKANEAAIMFLVKKDGFVFDTDLGGFMKGGQKLEQADLVRIVKSANFEEQIRDVMENHPDNPSPPAPSGPSGP